MWGIALHIYHCVQRDTSLMENVLDAKFSARVTKTEMERTTVSTPNSAWVEVMRALERDEEEEEREVYLNSAESKTSPRILMAAMKEEEERERVKEVGRPQKASKVLAHLAATPPLFLLHASVVGDLFNARSLHSCPIPCDRS